MLSPQVKTSALNSNINDNIYRLLIARVEEYAIFITDPNGYIMSWNLGAQQIFGHNDDEIIGKHISVLYIDADIRSGEALGNLNKALKKVRTKCRASG